MIVTISLTNRCPSPVQWDPLCRTIDVRLRRATSEQLQQSRCIVCQLPLLQGEVEAKEGKVGTGLQQSLHALQKIATPRLDAERHWALVDVDTFSEIHELHNLRLSSDFVRLAHCILAAQHIEPAQKESPFQNPEH